MQNQLIKIKNNSLIDEESFNSYFDSMVRLTFSEENCKNYLQQKNYYQNSEYSSDFSNKIHKNVLHFIEHINNYSNQDNAYLWQEFFIKNENISPVEFVKYGFENVPLVAFFMETENPVFNRIYQHLRFHKDWNADIVIGSEYVLAKLVEFKNKDFLSCLQKTGFQITDDTPQIYWSRGDKDIFKFIFDNKLINPDSEDSKNITQIIFTNMLKKSTSFEEIHDSMLFFERMNIKPSVQTINSLSGIFYKDYDKAETKEGVFENSYFYYYINQKDNYKIYESALNINSLLTDLLDSDEEEENNKKTVAIVLSFLKEKNIYPDAVEFENFYLNYGKYYPSDSEELQFVKTILINNSKDYLNKQIKNDKPASYNQKSRL